MCSSARWVSLRAAPASLCPASPALLPHTPRPSLAMGVLKLFPLPGSCPPLFPPVPQVWPSMNDHPQEASPISQSYTLSERSDFTLDPLYHTALDIISERRSRGGGYAPCFTFMNSPVTAATPNLSLHPARLCQSGGQSSPTDPLSDDAWFSGVQGNIMSKCPLPASSVKFFR